HRFYGIETPPCLPPFRTGISRGPSRETLYLSSCCAISIRIERRAHQFPRSEPAKMPRSISVDQFTGLIGGLHLPSLGTCREQRRFLRGLRRTRGRPSHHERR